MATGYRPYYIAATNSGGAKVCGPGTIGVVNVNTGAASAVLTLYDDVAVVAANKFAVIDCSAACTRVFALDLVRGCWAVLSGGNADVTITHM